MTVRCLVPFLGLVGCLLVNASGDRDAVYQVWCCGAFTR